MVISTNDYVNGCAYVTHTLYNKFYHYQNARKWQYGHAKNIMQEFQEIPECKNFIYSLNRITQNKLHYSKIILAYYRL